MATQSLFVLNSSLVYEAARALADSAHAAKDNDGERLRWLWLKCLGRSAEDREVDQAVRFLADYPAGETVRDREAVDGARAGWVALCQVLLASNEFIHVQ